MRAFPPPNIAHPGHPVIRAIWDRTVAGRPRSRGPGPGGKLGLVVEGGGMRGVLSGGALLAMGELGLTETFDEVYAESAGAINASYFLAGQGALGSRIYYEDAAGARFINPLRLGRIVDIDFLVDEVFAAVKPLDVGAVARSRTRAFISVTNAQTGNARSIEVRRAAVPLLHLLKATAAIVPLYDRAVPLDDGSYVDGGIADPIPIRRAIANGCTHILVLLTRPPAYRDRGFRGPVWLAARLLLGVKWNSSLVHALLHERYRRYNAARDLALGYAPPERPVSIAVICPDGHTHGVARLTRDSRRLRNALLASREQTLELFRGTG